MEDGEQIGIVSYGIGTCGKPDKLTVYTDIVYFRRWIEEKMKKYLFEG